MMITIISSSISIAISSVIVIVVHHVLLLLVWLLLVCVLLVLVVSLPERTPDLRCYSYEECTRLDETRLDQHISNYLNIAKATLTCINVQGR